MRYLLPIARYQLAITHPHWLRTKAEMKCIVGKRANGSTFTVDDKHTPLSTVCGWWPQ